MQDAVRLGAPPEVTCGHQALPVVCRTFVSRHVTLSFSTRAPKRIPPSPTIPMELAELTSEDLGFKLTRRVRVFSTPVEFDAPKPDNLRLLAVANVSSLVAVSDTNNVFLTELDVLNQKDDISEGSRTALALSFVSQIAFDASESVLYVLLEKTLLGVPTETFLLKKTLSRADFSVKIDHHVLSFATSPAKREEVACLTASNDLFVVLSSGNYSIPSVAQFSYSLDGKRLFVSSLGSSEMEAYENGTRVFLLTNPEVSSGSISYIQEIKPENEWLIVYNLGDDEDHDLRNFVAKKTSDGFEFLETFVASPFGSIVRKPVYYGAQLHEWVENQLFLFLTSSLSTEINTIGTYNDQETVLVSQLNDSERAEFPIEESTGDDASPVGFAIDLSNSQTTVEDPCMGVSSAQGLPKVLMLSHQGNLETWWVFHKAELKGDSKGLSRLLLYLQKCASISLKGPEVPSTKQNSAESGNPQNPFETANPFGKSSASAFHKPENEQKENLASSFGSFRLGEKKTGEESSKKSSFGDLNQVLNTPAFGSSGTGAFGASITKSAFGSSGFGSSSKSTETTLAFGTSGFGTSGFGSKTSEASEKKSGFGSSGFGASSFGSSGFGSSGSGTSGFGSSGFATAAKKESPFGSSGFGGSSASKSSPFGSISQNKASPFGSVSQNKDSPFGSASQNKDSPFGNVSKSKDSPFGSVSQSKGSPFGSVSRNKESPFGSISQEKPSLFGSNKPSALESKPKGDSPFGNIKSQEKTESPFAAFSKPSEKNTSPFGVSSTVSDEQKKSPFDLLNEKSGNKSKPLLGKNEATERKDSPFSSLSSQKSGASFGVLKPSLAFGDFAQALNASPFNNLGALNAKSQDETKGTETTFDFATLNAELNEENEGSKETETPHSVLSADSESYASYDEIDAQRDARDYRREQSSEGFSEIEPSSDEGEPEENYDVSLTKETTKLEQKDTEPHFSREKESETPAEFFEKESVPKIEAFETLSQETFTPAEIEEFRKRANAYRNGFVTFDGFTKSAVKDESELIQKICEVFVETSGHLNVLRHNVDNLVASIDSLENPSYPISDTAIDYPDVYQLRAIQPLRELSKELQDELSSRLEGLRTDSQSLEGVISDILSSQVQKYRIDKLITQLRLLQDENSTTNTKLRPLDFQYEVLQASLRLKVAKFRALENEVRSKLMPLKLRGNVDTRVIENLEKVTYQINSTLLKHVEDVRQLENEVSELQLSHEVKAGDTPLPSAMSTRWRLGRSAPLTVVPTSANVTQIG